MPLATSSSSSSSTATRGPGGPLGSDDDVGSGFDMRPLTSGSFSDADDGDLAAALNRRIGQIAVSTASFDSEVTEEEMRQPLTGEARDGGRGAAGQAGRYCMVQCGCWEPDGAAAYNGRAFRGNCVHKSARVATSYSSGRWRLPTALRCRRLARWGRIKAWTGQLAVPGTEAPALDGRYHHLHGIGLVRRKALQEALRSAALSPCPAAELRQLIYTKYGKTYDVSFVRRDIPGKTFVCLNIMWTHLEQRSFKLTEEQVGLWRGPGGTYAPRNALCLPSLRSSHFLQPGCAEALINCLNVFAYADTIKLRHTRLSAGPAVLLPCTTAGLVTRHPPHTSLGWATIMYLCSAMGSHLWPVPYSILPTLSLVQTPLPAHPHAPKTLFLRLQGSNVSVTR